MGTNSCICIIEHVVKKIRRKNFLPPLLTKVMHPLPSFLLHFHLKDEFSDGDGDEIPLDP